jgi:hypothetical protein
MCVHTSHQPYGYPLFCCVHGNEHTKTHDAICDTFVAIAQDASFHMGQKQLHVLPSTTFNSSRWRIHIVLTKNGIRTVANIVIVNPMWMDLLSWSCTTQGFVVFDAGQAKEKNYCNQHTIDQVLPLIIEVFGCLHKHADVFLHDCVNAIWSLKGP